MFHLTAQSMERSCLCYQQIYLSVKTLRDHSAIKQQVVWFISISSIRDYKSLELLKATFDTTRILRYMESTLREVEPRDTRKGQLFMKLIEPVAPAECQTGFSGSRQWDRVWDRIFLSMIKPYKRKEAGGRLGSKRRPTVIWSNNPLDILEGSSGRTAHPNSLVLSRNGWPFIPTLMSHQTWAAADRVRLCATGFL